MEFLYGHMVDAVPDTYVPRHQWPEFSTSAQIPAFMRPKKVSGLVKGARWGMWPLYLESYVSDTEPDLAAPGPSAAARVISWQRVGRHNVPAGWRVGPKSKGIEGFAVLGAQDYSAAWSESARRYRKKWLTTYANEYRIEPISFAEFAKNYKKSTVYKRARNGQLVVLERTLNDISGPHTILWGARRLRDSAIVAGLATVSSPTCLASYYQAGFIIPQPDRVPAMVGLMDHWFSEMTRNNFKYLQFGQFWRPGITKRSWQGFSLFKAKFGLSYIDSPPELIQFRVTNWR